MVHASRPAKKRWAVLSAVITPSTIGGIGGIAASSCPALFVFDVAHAFSSTSKCVPPSAPSVRCMKAKDTGLHYVNNNCRSARTCAVTLRAGPNSFVDGPEGGQSEEGNGSTSFPSPFSPFGSPTGTSNNGENGANGDGNGGHSPNPFMQPKPPISLGNNSPFGSGGSGGSSSSNSGAGSGPPSSPFGAKKNDGNGFAPNNTSGNQNPFQQQSQTQAQPPASNPVGGSSMPAAPSKGGFGSTDSQSQTKPAFPPNPNNNAIGTGGGSAQSPFGQSQNTRVGDTGTQVNSSPFGAGPPSLQTNNDAFGSASAMPPAAISPPSATPPADDTWVEFSIYPGHVPDPTYMSTTSTDYSNAIPRGLVLRTAKPGMRFGQTMTQKAEVVVSLGEEPLGQGIDDTEEPEKVWDLGPGEYVVNRGTRLDKTRMYVMDFEPSTTREGGVVLRTINPGIVDEYGNNVRLAEVVVSGGPDGKWREPKPQMEGMEGIVGSSMMDGGAGAMGGVDGGSNRVSRGFVAFSSGSLGPARRGGGGDSAGGGDGYTYGPAPQTGGDPYSLW